VLKSSCEVRVPTIIMFHFDYKGCLGCTALHATSTITCYCYFSYLRSNYLSSLELVIRQPSLRFQIVVRQLYTVIRQLSGSHHTLVSQSTGSCHFFFKYCSISTKKLHKDEVKKNIIDFLKFIMTFKQEFLPQNSRYTPLLCLKLSKK
jgi:hypothetical protein